MNGLLVLAIVVAIYYLLTKNYNTAAFSSPLRDQKQPFSGNLEDHETGLIVALMAKVAKADGRVSELEAQLIGLTLTDLSAIFDQNEAARDALKKIYNREKEDFQNTLILAQKYRQVTKASYERCIGLMEYLLNLAFIDGEFSKTERMITEDIANALGIKNQDYNTLISKFVQFYANKAREASMNEARAYEVLEIDNNATFQEIKTRYRALVREHHPDILMGKGAKQDIIDKATRKLQEINEAYELLKAIKA